MSDSVTVILCDYEDCEDDVGDESMVKVEGHIKGFRLTCLKCGRDVAVTAYRDLFKIQDDEERLSVLIDCGYCAEGESVELPAAPREVSEKGNEGI